MALPKPTPERVEAWLKSKELLYDVINKDGVVRVGYDEIVFFIAVNEPFISVTGMWMPDIVDEDRAAALQLANTINLSAAFPKAYVHDNSLVFFTAMPFEYGLSDEQLANYLDMSFAVVGEPLARAEAELAASAAAHNAKNDAN